MILRLWSGRATGPDADAYDDLLNTEIAPAIAGRGIPGLLDFGVWRRLQNEDDGGAEEFLTAMLFADQGSIREFTGGDMSVSVVPPRARALLTDFEEHPRHYELVRKHLGTSLAAERLLALPQFAAQWWKAQW